MAFRLVAQRAIRSTARSFATTKEMTIHITFVDQQGNKVVLPGLIGRNLLQTAQMHGIDMNGHCQGGGGTPQIRRTENWVEYLYGDGNNCGHCKVEVPEKFNKLLPERFEEELTALERAWEDEVTTQSRCACNITLTRELDGLVVMVPNPAVVEVI